MFPEFAFAISNLPLKRIHPSRRFDFLALQSKSCAGFVHSTLCPVPSSPCNPLSGLSFSVPLSSPQLTDKRDILTDWFHSARPPLGCELRILVVEPETSLRGRRESRRVSCGSEVSRSTRRCRGSRYDRSCKSKHDSVFAQSGEEEEWREAVQLSKSQV